MPDLMELMKPESHPVRPSLVLLDFFLQTLILSPLDGNKWLWNWLPHLMLTPPQPHLPPLSTPGGPNPFSSCPVLQKLQGPAAASEASAGCLQCHLCAQGQPAQEARAALLPGGY